MASLDGIGTLNKVLGNLGSNGQITGSSAAAEAAAAGKTTGTVLKSTPAVQDRTKVSSTGSLVSQALSTSDVRADKVASLQKAISEGSYQVSSGDVASKIVDNLLA